MDTLDHAVKTAGMRARGDEGDLRIGVHALTAGCFLDRLLERFHGKHPNVRLQISEGTARDAQLMVREDRLDIAFMAGSCEIPDLKSRAIWCDRLMVALSVRHPLAARRDVEWRQLAEETFLVRIGGAGPQAHDLIVVRSVGKWLMPAIQRVDVERSTLMSMIAGGHGISLFVEEGTAANTANVTFLPISDEPETIKFSAIWSPRNRDPALLNLLTLATKMGCPHPKSDSE